MSPLLLRLSGIVVLVFGLVLSHSGYRKLRDASASKDWPTTEGEVMYSVVRGDYDSSEIQRYWQEVHYAYSVDGVRYTSDQVRFGHTRSMLPETEAGSALSEEDMRRLLRDPKGVLDQRQRTPRGYPQGRKVTVHYNLDDPSVAVLEPGVTEGTFLPLIAGIIAAFVGLLVALSGRRVG